MTRFWIVDVRPLPHPLSSHKGPLNQIDSLLQKLLVGHQKYGNVESNDAMKTWSQSIDHGWKSTQKRSIKEASPWNGPKNTRGLRHVWQCHPNPYFLCGSIYINLWIAWKIAILLMYRLPVLASVEFSNMARCSSKSDELRIINSKGYTLRNITIYKREIDDFKQKRFIVNYY